MQEPSHIRAISLVLACSIVVAAWLLFEYSNRQAEQVALGSGSSQKPTVQAPQQSRPVRESSAQRPLTAMPDHLAITYKCEKDGRVLYSDQPCSIKQKTVSITAAEKGSPTTNNLQQLQGRLAAMEAYRHEREKEYAAAAASASPSPSTSTTTMGQRKEVMCQEIDRAMAVKDSELRQPHTAQWGDYLTGERRKLTDRRFSLGC